MKSEQNLGTDSATTSTGLPQMSGLPLDAENVSELIDNPVVRTALHKEHHAIQHLFSTSLLMLAIYVELVFLRWGINGQDDPLNFIGWLSVTILAIAQVGGYPYFNWFSSKTYKMIGQFGIGMLIGGIVALTINLNYADKTVTLLTLTFLMGVGALWCFSRYYCEKMVVSALDKLKGSPSPIFIL
mgnify:CR=1 FL=1